MTDMLVDYSFLATANPYSQVCDCVVYHEEIARDASYFRFENWLGGYLKKVFEYWETSRAERLNVEMPRAEMFDHK